ncbi:hypothetical protein LOTGIDRAFT_228780 [Lottia gigantea]|uniref:Uncharacterized protein n=1 Tax=Lottia gigantea TaxID=225164 RepID=V4A8D6_LOTGI|nr:hypothetical protein LOTGIDRAFT_228780 [Lottia gigantea]ESO91310.1 hypothetical protein LOTGIDRAFT_228780 [Lottia gigantea]
MPNGIDDNTNTMSFRKLFICTTFALCIGLALSDVHEDLTQLAEQFEGKFDNIDQFNYDIKHKPVQERHLHLITTSVPEDVPILIGFKCFYVEQYLNGNISNVIRQRLYTYGIDKKSQQVVLKLYSFSQPERFLHSPAHSDKFASLTIEDLIYAEGCDVYWTRLDSNYFRSNMFNTCIVNIAGAQVLIIDRNNLTSTYLTADETWVFYKNQSVLKVYPSPYNMSKYPIDEKHNLNNQNTLTRNSNGIDNFDNLIKRMKGGSVIRFVIDPQYCKSNNSDVIYGGDIEVFEFFFDSIFGPDQYFGFSESAVAVNSTGGVVTVLKEGYVYNNSGVQLKLTTLAPDLTTVLDKSMVACQFQGKGVLFYESRKQISTLESFQELTKALLNGQDVRFTADYRSCPPISAGALSGDFTFTKDGDQITKLTFSQSKVITNYQGSGYVTDIVIGHIFQNGSVTFYASDVQTFNHKPVYKETIRCKLGPSSVMLYTMS